MGAITLDKVSKRYYLHKQRDLLAQRALRRMPSASQELWALRDVSFRIEPSERVALIGRNGAGKSTVLSIVAGVTAPTTGTVDRSGRISALLELGSGFHPDLTGRENIFLNGALLGLRRHEVQAKFTSIVEFSELGRFIDEPLRTYSSGMGARLGFAVAVHVEPEILILDEVLGVGDAAFQVKCRDHIDEMVANGVTLLVVAHNSAIGTVCERSIWLDDGKVRLDGPSEEVLPAYHEATVPAGSEAQASLPLAYSLRSATPEANSEPEA